MTDETTMPEEVISEEVTPEVKAEGTEEVKAEATEEVKAEATDEVAPEQSILTIKKITLQGVIFVLLKKY